MKRSLFILCLVILTSCSGPSNQKIELTVSAAASLKDALAEIKQAFEVENENVLIYYNLGSTGSLQQQVMQGAPTDVFLSASKEHLTKLVDGNLIDRNQSADLLSNSLVVIGTNTETLKIQSLKDLSNDSIKRVSIGIPETVPAGKYAKEAMQAENVWDEIENKLVPAKDVRQVLSYVESDNVQIGIVYKTDASVSKKAKVLYEIPEGFHTPLVYSAGVVKNTKHAEEARAFYQFLQSKEAITIFEKYGFKGLND
ncbi:molybdate ABC transporter substrate-binding protein [Bacillus suaedaesalsae]|uniref:molybdate ABC transporter substrate-binding protein n=1 Tax=Bacillus suaedaesalsae TaxID=2810349 RepID=UPI001EF3FE98|nr:molybdate ABC transporter substrate-binding protein [Bacillus suaedaesalsae]